MSENSIPQADSTSPGEPPADEPPPTPPTPGEPGGATGGDEPTEPPPTAPDPTPEAPGPGDTITWEPRTWYEITFACLTPGCVNENIERYAPMFYSNDGQLKNIRVNCAADGACKKDCKILTAAKLDPQPIEE